MFSRRAKLPAEPVVPAVPRITVVQMAYYTATNRMNRASLAVSLNGTPFVDFDIYSRLVNKGESLLTLMQTDQKTLYEQTGHKGSRFTKPESVKDSGWTLKEDDTVMWLKDIIAPVLRALNSSACIEWDNRVIECVQDMPYMCGGQAMAATHANYTVGINCKLGIIGAMNSVGPTHMLKHSFRSWQQPPYMHHWSDMAFAAWDECTTVPPNNIIQMSITTPETVKLLNYLMLQADLMPKPGPQGWPIPTLPYPGKIFSAYSREGKSILGTLHGLGICWLLIDHKREFGIRFVDRINVFSIGGNYQLLFWLDTL